MFRVSGFKVGDLIKLKPGAVKSRFWSKDEHGVDHVRYEMDEESVLLIIEVYQADSMLGANHTWYKCMPSGYENHVSIAEKMIHRYEHA